MFYCLLMDDDQRTKRRAIRRRWHALPQDHYAGFDVDVDDNGSTCLVFADLHRSRALHARTVRS